MMDLERGFINATANFLNCGVVLETFKASIEQAAMNPPDDSGTLLATNFLETSQVICVTIL